MVNRSKQRGTAFESQVVAYLQEHGYPQAERRALSGSQDKGDVAGIPGLVVECKNCKTMELAGWVDEAHREAAAAGVRMGVVVHKRRQRGVGKSYVTLSLDDFVWLRRLADF